MALKLNQSVFGTPVRIYISGEEGVVTGFGCATEGWFSEDHLVEI